MSRVRIVWVSIAAVALVLSVTGCTTMKITMNPKAPANDLAKGKIPCKVGLLMDSTFQSYHWMGKSGAEMSKLDYDLGSASKSLFLESFMQTTKAVTLVNSKPPYSEADLKDVVIAVEPKIVGFSEKHSAVLRIANYEANITYHICVYDSSGKLLIDKDYSGNGVVQGKATNSPGSNYAAPAERAMSQAIVAIIDDIRKLPIKSE